MVVIAGRLQRNLELMQAFADSRELSLRPHAKTHKCAEIARMQVRLGATGISVATIGEAEALAGGGVDDVFVSYPLWADDDIVSRLSRLTERLRMRIGTDSAEAVTRLADLAGRVGIWIEVDCGLRRSGVAPAEAPVVARVARDAGFDVEGVFTFPGHAYAPGMQRSAARDEAVALELAASALERAGFGHVLKSGGSTPSARNTDPSKVDELRPGVYVFNDAQQLELGVAGFDDVALVVAATVVGKPESGRVVLDAGSKAIGPDRPAWVTGHGRLADYPDARVIGLWEHHAVVEMSGPEQPLLGDVLAVVPNHVCTAVNLVSNLLVVDGGEVVDTWPVSGRGANR